MSDSNNLKETKPKSSFNKSKSISQAINDLENNRDLSKAKVSNSEDVASIESDVEEVSVDSEDIAPVENDIKEFSMESESIDNLDSLNHFDNGKKGHSLFDDEVLVKPTKKSISSKDNFAKPNFKSSSNKKDLNINSKLSKIDLNNKLSFILPLTKAKVFGFIGVIIGLIVLIIGISKYFAASDRVIDHVLIGEAGSWSIILVLLGIIIILLSIYFARYYSGKTSSKFNLSTFEEIQNIDREVYESYGNNSESIFKTIFKTDEELENDNSSTDEIIVEKTQNSIFSEEKMSKSDDIGVFDSNNADNATNSSFDEN